MVIRTRGHLGQVGHGHHLAVAPQLFHKAAHGLGHGSAHARVHLVKNQCLRGTQLAGGHGNGQGNAREFPARSHLAHRTRCATCVACHQKGHVFQPALLGAGTGLQIHLELPALHAQALHGLGNGLGQQRCSLGACFGDRPGFCQVGGMGLGFCGTQAVQVCRSVQLGQLGAPGFQQGWQVFGRALVAPCQRHPE
ncbi:hypothetical protein NIES3787_41410 [Microcystis aeruginosa NIES-3787]|uniref:Uncharacterized protein n=1 Tax=Microcystis aeruginosa NIES-3787 TaxID=2517782 RepID=A0A6H9GRP6_MICAE|nr:hypothetical protein NIES3787_41410 [Microcystis aeruginosa NIES-3787]